MVDKADNGQKKIFLEKESDGRSTLSLGIKIDVATLNRAMQNVGSSSDSRSKTDGSNNDHDRMKKASSFLKVRDSGSASSTDAFEKAFDALRAENKNKNCVTDTKLTDSTSSKSTSESSPNKFSNSAKFPKKKIRSGKDASSGNNESFNDSNSARQKQNKSRFARQKRENTTNDSSIDKIDVREYEMLYGGSIIIKSSFNSNNSEAPRKKTRTRSSLTVPVVASSSKDKKIKISGQMIVKDLADRMNVRVPILLKGLMSLGVSGNINQSLSVDEIELVCAEMGYLCELERSDTEKKIDVLMSDLSGKKGEGNVRAPLVTVMGHVDHGKTSLLDAIRNSNVVNKESGGITQHIGAYIVDVKLRDGDKRQVCFIDTPGHAAFTEMRLRGAKITDIVVLVVAADDGIMAQTIEAINHIKISGAHVIVAANKIDREGIDLEKLKSELSKYDIIVEDYGGDVPFIPLSAKTGKNLDTLLETIALHADVMELKAKFDGPAAGTIIESRMDKRKGVVATMLVQSGTLKQGDIVSCLSAFGRVRDMSNDSGVSVKYATPSMPVEIIGLNFTPKAGDRFIVTVTEKEATQVYEEGKKIDQNLSNLGAREINFGNKKKELNIIVKGDVWGSVEAASLLLSKIKSNEVSINIIHKGVGAVSASDMSLMSTTEGIICGFKVAIDKKARLVSDSKLDIRIYDVIYDLENDIKDKLIDMLDREIKETKTGSGVIRKIFKISKVGIIFGSYISDGLITSSSLIKIYRDKELVGESKVSSLKSVDDNVKEIVSGHECGIKLTNNMSLQEGDKFEIFSVELVRPDKLL
ncbi:MAG: translation initiation factor IF-2 [Alphaproteobacteria bacterium]|nr:translation initiation factor IF-2 [Rickettsiales bacterium]